MKIIDFFSICFLLLSLAQFNINAENLKANVRGKVFGEDNVPLVGAHVSLPSLERGTVTNNNGEFSFSNIPIGNQRFSVSYIGYESLLQLVDIEGDFVELTFTLKQTAIQTETIVITGNPYANSPLNTPQDITSISGHDMLKKESASLGKTIESIPGVYNMSAGSVAGKPVIRGHSGERVLTLTDGIPLEYQQYGERHAPNIEINNFERVEVVKGASSLLYGSDAMGGAVNLISHPYHFSTDGAFTLGGRLSGNYNSNNNEYMTGLNLNASGNLFSLFGSIVKRKADNFNTPEADSYSATMKSGDPRFTGEIPHTNFEQLNSSVGIGYLSPFGIISADYKNYINKNNFLLPTGNPIGLNLENHIVAVKGNFPLENFILRPKFSYQKNIRKATKAGLDYSSLPDSAAVNLGLDVYTARFDIENIDLFDLSGSFGFEVKHYDHRNVGTVPLQPTGFFTNYSLYIFEEWRQNKLTLNIGARFDYRNQTFYGTTTNPLLREDDKRSYTNLSGSIGASYKVTDNLTGSVNFSRGFRTPSFFNLYVYGEHGGVFAFQIGNPDLKNETSFDISGSLNFINDVIKSSATIFYNTVDNYIFLYNAPDHPLAPSGKTFVFAHDQADARLFGFELNIESRIASWLTVHADYSTLRSRFLNGPWEEDELPLMPPDRASAGTKFLLPDFSLLNAPYIMLNARYVSDKDAAGIYEPFGQFDEGIGPDIPFGVCSTGDYFLLNAGFGFTTEISNRQLLFDFEITNILDEVYRDFFDTYKGYSLSPGRSFNLRFNLLF